ncbi:hypothetical protein [Corallococcus interemptor]|uniref:hypothetical protein n=1 Tax=Corallococcus interemptor TaxID=2316720 RepID=UPI0011C3CD8B|nr:hypothetical protein [Corallococcus interemptor]
MRSVRPVWSVLAVLSCVLSSTGALGAEAPWAVVLEEQAQAKERVLALQAQVKQGSTDDLSLVEVAADQPGPDAWRRFNVSMAGQHAAHLVWSARKCEWEMDAPEPEGQDM